MLELFYCAKIDLAHYLLVEFHLIQNLHFTVFSAISDECFVYLMYIRFRMSSVPDRIDLETYLLTFLRVNVIKDLWTHLQGISQVAIYYF